MDETYKSGMGVQFSMMQPRSGIANTAITSINPRVEIRCQRMGVGDKFPGPTKAKTLLMFTVAKVV